MPPACRRLFARRLLPGLIIGGISIALANSTYGQLLADKYGFDRMAWFDRPQLTQHLRLLMRANHLVNVPDNCIVLLLHDLPDGPTDVTVLRKFTDGCPSTRKIPLAPYKETLEAADRDPDNKFGNKVADLFHLRVDRINEEILTDAGTPNVYRPLTAPRLPFLGA